jgi:flagellar protein FlbB
LDTLEQGLRSQEEELNQMIEQLQEKEQVLEDREKLFNERIKAFDNRRDNLRQNATYLVGMPPESAVKILLEMEDQDVIDIFRMTEEQAQEAGEISLVSYWLSLMPSERAAVLQRKMARKPGG